ncbi:sugar transferase [Oligoflexus tunisiensis]|uniref:sugar transferase n=1 Tax=Oligoflexus tunisiensis TaxID=708132 RepID=UPI000AD01778|nr:exopolysaccharide biosynthesis polyprenyl glycosylphosphotransferase [Oligoflexus tunisiensis]
MDMDQNQLPEPKSGVPQPKSIEGIRIEAPQTWRPTPHVWQTDDLGRASLRFSPDLKRMLNRETVQRPVQRFLKRFMDIVLTGSALILLAPIAGMIILAIKLDSPGPVYFSQTRVGRGGRLFRLHKFRTMVTNAEELKQTLLAKNELDGPVFKIRNDPRVTRVGRFLRKTSLDELPQLWNVLIGDMSLVGPRPALPSEVVHWEKWQCRRLVVEQGCTCIWQVSGRSNLSFKEWMRMDMEYVYNWSLWLDLKLIVLTIWVMLTGRGAY